MKNQNKSYFILIMLLIWSTVSFGQTTKAVTEYLNIRGPIVFDNHAYNLSWSSHPNANYFKQEYIQAGENANQFKSMILIDVVTGKTKIKDIVSAKMAELKKQKESNPIVNYQIFSNAKNGEYMIDFLLSDNAPFGKDISVVERNVYRYKEITDKSGQKGILLFGVSTRSYGNDINNFLTGLKTNKTQLVKLVSQFVMPEITIAK